MNNGYEAGLSRDAASFASFLANLAAPEDRDSPAREADRWDCDGLAEDVATISGVDLRAPVAERELLFSQVRTHGPGAPISVPAELRKGLSSVEGGCALRKTASVTIRMTQGECDQLQGRAAAAGMTVSAYLRLCVFEAETLRAQVKEALAQFNAGAVADRRTPKKDVASVSGWRSRFFPRRSGHCPSARA